MIPTNEQIVHDLATAWRTLNPELIIKHLATTFQYDSMWVFESLDYEGYSKYIRGKFHTLKRSGSQLTIQKVPGRKAISISQDGKERLLSNLASCLNDTIIDLQRIIV